MKTILKLCKKHGQLSLENILKNGNKIRCRFCKKETDKKYDDKNPGRMINKQYSANLKNKYNLNEEEYAKIFISQNGLCAICKKPESIKGAKSKRWPSINSSIKRLCIDHDHKTGKVRALLCHKCNLILGHSDESIEILESSIDYLKDHNKN